MAKRRQMSSVGDRRVGYRGTGTWTAQVPSRQGGTREQTFNFKADGCKLTGTISGRGDVTIMDGKISGDTISFTVKMEYGGNTRAEVYRHCIGRRNQIQARGRPRPRERVCGEARQVIGGTVYS